MDKIKAVVISAEQISSNLRVIKFSLPNNFSFVPGQSIALHINKKEAGIENETRYFSIASLPNKLFVEILIKHNPQSAVSNYLFSTLKEKDDLEVSGPYGKAVFRSDAGHLTLIAGGTGIAPFVSMIRHASENKLPMPIHLVYSSKKADDFAFKSELDNTKNLKVDYIATQEDNWEGHKKRINLDYIQEKLANEGLFYICGPKQMVSDVAGYLKEFGVPEENIIFEKY